MADVISSEVYAYDVFLSFRGEDTRKTFTDHLYTALLVAGIRTFRDNEGIERGENIKCELEKGIMHSRCSIIILSQNYSSSTWCLDELVTILDRKRKNSKHVILPIFYHVDPSDVRKQKENFAKAFAVHESKNELKEKVKRWREALREVADLGGMSLQNQDDGYESKFIQKVVKVIEERLKRTILSIPPYLVGIESRVEHLNLWLQDGSSEVAILVLCGMSGIGKTTIAKYVFNLHFERFEASSFLANIREVSKLPDGLIRLQTQLLSDVLRGKKKEVWNVDEGIIRIRDAISCKKVLLVLDDMDTIDQFEAILGMRDSLHPGSKIIITTKNTQVLPHESYEIHNVAKMNFDESTRLFCWHAFGQDYPFDSHQNHSKKVVTNCGGLPLALKVLGSSLRGKEVDVWKSALEKLESIPDNQIFKKLVLSYDSLSDDHDKNLFLEISCFFVGKEKDYTVTVLDGCGFYTIVGIHNLMDRCLLTIDSKNKLMMHQMIQEMGKEVIRQESPNNPGKRTRLWRHKDSFHVLSEDTGTETITGLALDMKVVKQDKSNCTTNHAKRRHDGEFEDRNFLKRLRFNFFSRHSVNTASTDSYDVCLTTDAFMRMRKLSLLQINYTNLIGNYKEFPKNLKWLCWRGFSKHFVPNDFPLESLVAVDMRNSRLEQVWKGYRFLGSLKILNLSHSHELISSPNFTSLPQLERLILKDCVSLVEVHESIGTLETKLVVLNLKDCKNLRNLPKNICTLKVLETFVISGCSNLVQLPQDMTKMESLKAFHADKIRMNPLVSVFTSSQDELLQTLISKWVSRPRKYPKLSWDSLPRSLVSLSLSDCNLYDYSFPKDFTNLPKLNILNLSNNPICSLPDCIRGVRSLERLILRSCFRLKELIDLPGVKDLYVGHCTSLEKITYQSGSYHVESTAYGCKKLVYEEGSFKLEPIYKMESKVLKNLGMDHYDLQALNCAEMILSNHSTGMHQKGPIQGLFERGITSIFHPGGKIPSWFSNINSGSSVSLTIPLSSSNTRIKGLNLCTVYAVDNKLWIPSLQLFKIIKNKTKNLEFIYSPTCLGVSKSGEDIIWLSFWKFHQDMLNEGDEIELSMHALPSFEVKQVGIRVVYEDEEKRDTESSGKEIVIQQQNYHCDDFVPVELSEYRGTTDTIGIGYIGCALDYMLEDVPRTYLGRLYLLPEPEEIEIN